MATWKSENSMLTLLGAELLNKIKVGQGSITVTRIVAGSGRVAESQLYKQTTISGVQKLLTLNGYNTTNAGSEISFSISNEGLNEVFVVQQIGVFVTHPDYEGEILYHISQCNEGDPDNIPAYDDNVVTIGYSLYLEHGNSSSIVLNVDPEGMVTVEQFNSYKTEVNSQLTLLGKNITNLDSEVSTRISNAVTPVSNKVNTLSDNFNTFKTGIKVGKLVTADAKGNLVAGGKTVVSGTSLSVTDAISHRALSLSVAGKSTQSGTPSPSSPIYLTNTKVTNVSSSDGSNQKVVTFPSVIELRSIDNYADTIEWDGAKWWKVQRIAEVVVDGTVVSFGRPAHGNSTNYSQGTIYTLDSEGKVQTFNDVMPSSPVITSHGNGSTTTAKFYGYLEAISGTPQYRIRLHTLYTAIGLQTGQKDATARLNEILAWFKAQNDAGTPVKVWYVLNTPIVTEISATEVLEMFANKTDIACYVEGNTPSMTLGYALNTTDDTTMYILKSLARKSDIQVANTFAVAEVIE